MMMMMMMMVMMMMMMMICDDLCICFRLGKGPTRRIMVGPFRLVVHCRVARKKTLS